MDFSKRIDGQGKYIKRFKDEKTIGLKENTSLDGRCIKCKSKKTVPVKVLTKVLAKRKCEDCGVEFWSEFTGEMKQDDKIIVRQDTENNVIN